MAGSYALDVLSVDADVASLIRQAHAEYGTRPVTAPPMSQDIVAQYQVGGSPLMPNQSRARAAISVHANDVEEIMNDVTRVFDLSFDDIDHLRWMLRQGLADQTTIMTAAESIGAPRRMFTTSPPRSHVAVNTPEATQFPDTQSHATFLPLRLILSCGFHFNQEALKT